MFTNSSNNVFHGGSFTNVQGNINNYSIQTDTASVVTKIRGLLSPANCDGRHKKAQAVIRTRLDAGRWMLESAPYNEWKSSNPSSRLLWLRGSPGAGKTVLSSIAIEDIRKMPGATVIFFYCEFQDPTKRNHTILLSTLLDQLLDQLELPNVSPTTEGLLHRLSSRRSLHELDLEYLILTFAAEFDQVFVFIDGLDECEPEELEELVQNITNIATKLHVFIASREQPEIRLEFDGNLQLTIRPGDIAADLRQFAEAGVKHLKVGDPTLITEIVETLVQGAGGTFLWPVYHMQRLRKLRTDHDIRVALQNLPPGIDNTYIRALESIDALPNSQRLRLVLMMVCCATIPLTLPQLAEGIAVEEMDRTWDSSRVVNDMMSLIDDCANLLVCVPNVFNPSRPEPYIVRPFHASVKDFLLSKSTRMTGNLGKYSFYPASHAHDRLARLCLSYLTLRAFRGMSIAVSSSPQCTQISQYPFACYAIQEWLRHIHASGTAELADQFLDFLSAKGPTLEKWRYLYGRLISRLSGWQLGDQLDKEDIQHYTALQIAVFFELPMMIRHIGIDKIREKDVRSSGFTALHLAVKRGSVSVVACLLEMGAEVNDVDNKGNSPLHLAVARFDSFNARTVLQQLLDASADVNARDGSGCTSLHLAAEKAQDSFIPLLLQHGANIEAVDDCSCSPLHSAAKGTEFLFLKTIIKPESLAEVEAETAIKYENAMTVLLEHGAKLEAVDNKSRTPLHTAADNGLEFILEFLLQRGARVDAIDEDLHTPLHLAMTCNVTEVFPYAQNPVSFSVGSESAVACLLKWKTDVNVIDIKGWTPLHLALTHRCKSSVLALLFNAGTDTNAVDHNGWTPLHIAAIATPFVPDEVNVRRVISWVACREIVAILLHHGTDQDVTELQRIAANMIIQLMMSWGAAAQPVAEDTGGPRHSSALWFRDVLMLALDKGARLDILDCQGRSALHYALIHWGGWLQNNHGILKITSQVNEDTTLRSAYHEWTAILGMLQDHAKKGSRSTTRLASDRSNISSGNSSELTRNSSDEESRCVSM